MQKYKTILRLQYQYIVILRIKSPNYIFIRNFIKKVLFKTKISLISQLNIKMMNMKKIIFIIIIIALGVYIWFSSIIFITLKEEEKGILFNKLNGNIDTEHVYNEGVLMKAPWNEMIIYNIKEQEINETIDVLDIKGLQFHVKISAKFHPIYKQIGKLHESYGVNYIDKLVVPEVRAIIRRIMGHYNLKEIVSKKEKIETEIFSEIKRTLISPQANIKLTNFSINSIDIPESSN